MIVSDKKKKKQFINDIMNSDIRFNKQLWQHHPQGAQKKLSLSTVDTVAVAAH